MFFYDLEVSNITELFTLDMPIEWLRKWRFCCALRPNMALYCDCIGHWLSAELLLKPFN